MSQDEQPVVDQDTPEGAVRRSRTKLVVFFAGILVVAAAFVTSGMILRPNMLNRAGHFQVAVTNKSDAKLRVDIIVEGRPTSFDMAPNKTALLRYNIHKTTLVRFDLYKKNQRVHSVAEGPFEAGERGRLTVDLLSENEVALAFASSGTNAGAAKP
jgi:hypothetical protein